MTRVTDERLAELRAHHSRLAEINDYWQVHSHTADMLRELEAARLVIGCYCPKCDGKFWVQHECPGPTIAPASGVEGHAVTLA